MRQANLIELGGPLAGRRTELHGLLTIGRDETTDLVIADSSVSRRHARVREDAGRYLLEDLGSTNGTFVAGKRLAPGDPTPVESGALIQLGTVELKLYVYDPAASGRRFVSRTPTDVVVPVPAGRERGRERLVGASAATARIRDELIPRYAAHGAPVLITGESGTGKEVIARALHEESPRAERPWISLSCAELSPAQIEAELFGAEPGSYTGQAGAREGLFRAADGGTLFLDEIGELPLAQQGKLLRVLQEGEVRPVGATRPVAVDLRIVAATNRNLEARVRQGMFREDLFYRLEVLRVRVPPLRERPEDIPPLAEHLLRRARREVRTAVPARRFSPEALAALAGSPWPGNVRELSNYIQRMVLYWTNAVVSADELQLSPPIGSGKSAGESRDSTHARTVEAVALSSADMLGAALDSWFSTCIRRRPETLVSLAALERLYIERTLALVDNKTRAAELLGIGRQTLYERLRSYREGD